MASSGHHCSLSSKLHSHGTLTFQGAHPMELCEPRCNLSSWESAVATQLPLPPPTPTQTWRGIQEGVAA